MLTLCILVSTLASLLERGRDESGTGGFVLLAYTCLPVWWPYWKGISLRHKEEKVDEAHYDEVLLMLLTRR